MSDKDHSDEPVFKNPETVRRRAWIDRALAGVRSRLDPDAGTDARQAEPEPPRLYVIRNDRSR